jgi:hypothetical protein
VAEVKIPYYSVRRNGRGFWEPRPHMRAAGFSSVPCGPDGSSAWAIAEEWNRRWVAVRRGEAPSPAMATAENLSPEQSEELTIYPPRSLGDAFRRYRRTAEWRSKAPRTREDWWRVWRRMKPIFGDCGPRTVTLEDIDAWRTTVEEMVSLREAHRCIKIWRAMWGVSAALLRTRCRSVARHHQSGGKGPLGGVDRGRSGPAVQARMARALLWPRGGDRGVVVNSAKPRRCAHAGGLVVGHRWCRSGVGALSDRALAAVEAYIQVLGVELHRDAPIFRNRSGAPYSSDTLGDDFRDIRHLAFGPAESRTLADFRRSGTQEAFAGDAKPADVSHAMGNTIATSNMLFATYNPVNIVSVRKVHEARIRGRRTLRERGRTVRPALGKKG